MPGLTAYVGLLDIGEPRAGDTVVVGAATGAVGSVVGQIAKIKGCRAVGVAGGRDKCDYARDVLRFDDCIDHRAADLPQRLAAACPRGIDVYFESVGGAVLAAVVPLLNVGARVDAASRRRGLILRVVGDRLVFAPPLIIEASEIEEIASRLEHALDDVADELTREGALR